VLAAAEQSIERAVYGGRYFAHFGHFLLETAPALYQAAPHAQVISCHPNPAAWQPAWITARFRGFILEALAIAPERIHLIQQTTRFGELMVPPLEAGPVTRVVGPNYIAASAKIRDYALAHGETPQAQRIYLSRRQFTGGSYRALENEAALEDMLGRRGFMIVIPEQLPIDEQIRTVANADFVVGIDGSALHLCGFMRPGGAVLMIETRPFPVQRAINKALGLKTLTAPASFVRKEEGVDLYTTDIATIERLIS
jgi:capsular polysaccharide biosynthesis protein